MQNGKAYNISPIRYGKNETKRRNGLNINSDDFFEEQ